MVALGADHHIHKHLTIAEIFEEVKRMKDIGLPITAINLVHYVKSMISVGFLGRLGRLELAGGALAVGFTNITGYSVLSGLALGMEPISSQARGSGNRGLLLATLRRAVALLLLASLPISLLWLRLRPILLALNQDPAVAAVAARYCLYSLPDLLANSLLHPVRIHFRAQGDALPLMYSSAFSAALHLPLTAFLTRTLGVAGVAAAACATNFNTLLFLFAYTTLLNRPSGASSLYAPLGGGGGDDDNDDTACSAGWGPLLKLAVPSCLGVCLEWWWYELMTLASGYLENPRVALAASAIVIQTTSLMYTLPTTLGAAASARVGNELGAGRPRRARAAAAAAMALAAAGSCVSLAWATLARGAWGRVFTDDGEVLELARAVLPVIGLCELANCPQTTGCGVLRGTARPAVGAAINFYSFYLIGAPVAGFLAFGLGLGLVGLCLGLLTAQVACAVSVAAAVSVTDWEREAARAESLVGEAVARRVAKEEEEEEEEEGGSGGGGAFLREVVVFDK